METWNIRAACIIFFLLVSPSKNKRALLRFGKSITESLSNSGLTIRGVICHPETTPRSTGTPALCDVVRLCINREREKRAAMGEVARMMRGVTALSPEQATPCDNPLWWDELEIASAAE